MSLSALFYTNGVLEGVTGFIAFTYPEILSGQKKKADKYTKMYARRFGSMLGAFSIASILIAKQPDSGTKQIFSIGWLIFHAAVTIERAINVNHMRISSVLIHGTMSLAFMYYIYKSDFKKTTFMIWRLENK